MIKYVSLFIIISFFVSPWIILVIMYRRFKKQIDTLEENMETVFQDNNYVMNGDYRVYVLDLLIQDAVKNEAYLQASIFQKEKEAYLKKVKLEYVDKNKA